MPVSLFNRLFRERRMRYGLAMLGLCTGFATGSWAVDEGATPVGLQDLMPAEVPEGLGVDDFAALDGNWAEWSAQTAEVVAELFKWEGNMDAQKASLAAAKAKLGVMNKAMADSRYQSLATPLANLSSRLSLYTDLSEAMLATLSLDPAAARDAKLATSKTTVSRSLAALESDLNAISGGSAWLPYFQTEALKAALADSNSENLLTAAKATHEKLVGRQNLTDEAQKAFVARPSFQNLQDSLASYVGVADAPVATDAPAQLRPLFAELIPTLNAWQRNGEGAQAAKFRELFRKIRETAPDGGDLIATALQKHVFNYNLRVVATEEFLSRLLSEARTESGQVRDYVLGAAVGGYQTTTTRLGVDIKPSKTSLQFDLVLNGTVQSNTAGATSQATIYTSGYHTFTSVKPVAYDGVAFTTSPATIAVNANNTTTGASTNFSGGLFGGFAERIAMKEAAARRPQSEAIARQRVAERVLPRFNSEVDQSFQKASARIESETWSHLRSVGLEPDAKQFQSTETAALISTRLMGDVELAANTPDVNLASPRGATVMVHESLLSNSADRMGLQGQTLTDQELSAKIEEFLTKAMGREVDLPEREAADEEAANTAFVFADKDPIRFTIADGVLNLIFRTGFRREGREEIPVTEIVVPLQFELRDNEVVVTSGLPQVVGTASIATRGVIRKKIQSSLPERTFTRDVKIKGENKELPAKISQIKLLDSWLLMTVE